MHWTLPAVAAGALLFAERSTALDSAQVASVFGSSATDLTGATTSLPDFDLTIVTNATHALVTMNATNTAPDDAGWMAIGTGTRMANADYLIAWPNIGASASGGSPWTLSHRQPGNTRSAEVMPVSAANSSTQATSAFYTLVPELSSTASSPYTAVTCLRLLQPPSDYPTISSASDNAALTRASTNFIFASSSQGPDSADENATIRQHDRAHSRTSLDLSQAYSLAAAASPTETDSDSESAGESGAAEGSTGGRTTNDMYIIAHAVTGSLGLLLFAPLGILAGRYLRSFRWFPVHAGLMGLAAALVITCFGLGVYVAGGEFEDTHHKVGLAIFIVIIVQVLIGAFAHRTRAEPAPTARLPTLARKSPLRLIHIPLGLIVIALGWWNIHEGFEEWETKSDALTEVPTGVVVVFWILVGVFAAAYVVGWVLEAFTGLNKPRRGSFDDTLPMKQARAT